MDNRERIRYFYEVVVSNHLIDEVEEYISNSCTVRTGEKRIPSGVDGMKQHLIDVRKTYPELKMTITRQYCDGDYVISEFVTECIHGGEWLGMKPTGKKLTFTGVDIDKVVDGKIVEHGGAMNTFETLFEEKIICPSRETGMAFVIEQLPLQSVLYMRRTGAYGAENYQLMESLKQWAKDNGLLKDSTIYGIAHDGPNTPPEQCRYDVCLVASAEYPSDVSVLRGEIPGGNYAVFTIPHTAEAVQAFWGEVIPVLHEKGVRIDLEKPILERYKHRLVKEGKCEFCVPVI